MKMTLTALETLIINWADARGILEYSNPTAQLLKTYSEFGELCDNIIKGRSVKDDIGDMIVTLVIGAKLRREWKGREGNLLTAKNMNYILYDLGTSPNEVALVLADTLYTVYEESNYAPAVTVLKVLANIHNLTLEECVEHAWNEIKDRKGHMTPGGAFVKEEDTYEGECCVGDKTNCICEGKK